MPVVLRTARAPLLAACLAIAWVAAAAQAIAADYSLTAPIPVAEPDMATRLPLASWGPLRLARTASISGNGLSLQAGEQWFAGVVVGHSLDRELYSLGGGYRVRDGDVVSMHVARQLGQDRLGLAVRYDRARSYLRLSYETAPRPLNGPDRLRFSAGLRF